MSEQPSHCHCSSQPMSCTCPLPWQARGAQGGIGESAPAGAGTRQPFLPQHPRAVQTFDNDLAVGFSQPCRQDVQVMSADIVDPAVQPANLCGALTAAPRAGPALMGSSRAWAEGQTPRIRRPGRASHYPLSPTGAVDRRAESRTESRDRQRFPGCSGEAPSRLLLREDRHRL